MANRKSGKKQIKPGSKIKTRPKGNHLKTQLSKVIAGFFILVGLVMIAIGLTHHLLLRPTTEPLTSPAVTGSIPPEAHLSKPPYEIFPKIDRPPLPPIPPEKDFQPVENLPKVAIIIDDMGYDLKIAKKFLELKGPLTFAVLPKAPFNSTIIETAHRKGFEIMLHLPMEPKEYPKVNPGPGALLTTMDPDHLISQLTENLTDIPYLKGVNNHMGSKMTASSSQMRQIFTILKKRQLFYIDSRTSADTVCRSSARLLRLPFAERDIFIDHLLDPQFIKNQIVKLIQRAQKNGQAVGIAHPHSVTFDLLKFHLSKFKKDVQLVTASQVVRQL